MSGYNIYQFSQYPEDEFWLVTDVDKNWSNERISPNEGKTFYDEWKDTIEMCKTKNYRYAISNPFFEVWLLLHHDIPNDEDKSFAVTDTHLYEKTDHFRTRLRNLGVPLEDRKHMKPFDYNIEKVKTAISRAEALHLEKTDLYPRYFVTTVYILMNKIMNMLPKNE